MSGFQTTGRRPCIALAARLAEPSARTSREKVVSCPSTDDDETPAIATALPSHAAEKRDALGNLCFYLHFAVMIYIVTGWLVPFRGALIVYLCFLPAVAVQWQFNKNSCVLNNVESLIRSGRWRDPNNKEEGAWLQTLALKRHRHPLQALADGRLHLLHRRGALERRTQPSSVVVKSRIPWPLKRVFVLPT